MTLLTPTFNVEAKNDKIRAHGETGPAAASPSSSSSTDNRPLYDGLFVMDLEDMTVDNTIGATTTKTPKNNEKKDTTDDSTVLGFELIVAADVLVYFGSLDNLFRIFSEISVPGALMVVSCERATSEEAPLGWRLLPSGRFAHTQHHVYDAAQKVGYQPILYQEIVPRMEKGEPVKGHLFGFELQQKKSQNDEL